MTYTDHNLQMLIETIRALRGPDGCPWDKRQTNTSLIKHLNSETIELVEGVEKADHSNICEELGDLLYLIIMFSEINKDLGHFRLSDVVQSINEKLIRRHPHVFADATYDNDQQLADQWEAIKAEEKKK